MFDQHTTHKQCQLLGGLFAYGVQAALGLVCLLALVLKWRCESPRRSGKVFLADGCKQAIAALVAHGFNMLLAAGLQKAAGKGADQCAWYFMNYIWDTALGVWVAYALLMWLERVARRRVRGRPGGTWAALASTGDYGQGAPGDPDAPELKCSTRERWFRTWAWQLFAWTVIEVVMKGALAAVQYALRRPLGVLARALLTRPFAGRPDAELVVVMVGAPGAMNVLIFWIQDAFLKRQPDGEPGCFTRVARRVRRACCGCCGCGGGDRDRRRAGRLRFWSGSEMEAPLMNGKQDYHSVMAANANANVASGVNGAGGNGGNGGNGDRRRGSKALDIDASPAGSGGAFDASRSFGLDEFGGTPGATPGENEIMAAAMRWQETSGDFGADTP